MGGLRRGVERRSGPLLVVLSRQPKPLVPLLFVALLGVLVFAPPAPALLALTLLLAGVGWLSYLSWPVVEPRARVVRVATLALLLLLGLQSLL